MRFLMIPNGVDIERFRPLDSSERPALRERLGLPSEARVILFVGHWSKSHKCPDMLLDAWQEHVADSRPDSVLLFIGSMDHRHFEVDSELVDEVREKAKLYVGKRIFFVERTHEIEKYYRAADLFVLPSLMEGLPNALLEAMDCSLPVVATKLDGVTDWVVTDGKNGLFVEPGIRNDLGRAIERILDEGVLAESFGREARRTVLERFSVKRVAEEYAQLYGELVPSA